MFCQLTISVSVVYFLNNSPPHWVTNSTIQDSISTAGYHPVLPPFTPSSITFLECILCVYILHYSRYSRYVSILLIIHDHAELQYGWLCIPHKDVIIVKLYIHRKEYKEVITYASAGFEMPKHYDFTEGNKYLYNSMSS